MTYHKSEWLTEIPLQKLAFLYPPAQALSQHNYATLPAEENCTPLGE